METKQQVLAILTLKIADAEAKEDFILLYNLERLLSWLNRKANPDMSNFPNWERLLKNCYTGKRINN